VESEGAADEAVLITVHRNKIQKIPLLEIQLNKKIWMKKIDKH
jgi:hypothetical protein